MREALLLPFILVLFLIPCFAQDNSTCPIIEVIASPKEIKEYEPMVFSVSLSEEAKKFNLEYKWTTSLAGIVEGQGTPSIKVYTDGLADAAITATVEINGLPENCPHKFSKTGIVATIIEERAIAEYYGKVPWREQIVRLDNLYSALISSKEDSLGLFWMRIDKDETINSAKKHIQKLIRLSEKRGRRYDIGRLIFFIEQSETISTSLLVIGSEENWKCENCVVIKGKDILANKK